MSTENSQRPMTLRNWRQFSTRRAFLTHLTISATVVGSVFAVVFVLWYPPPYFAVRGASDILRVLVGVDLVLGPLLTLILFRPNKRGLGLDVTMIAMVQLAALVYGTSVIFVERPYYAVFAVDRFDVLARRDVDPVAAAAAGFARKPLRGPMLVYATRPTDPAEFQKLLEETVFGGAPDLERRPEYWHPFDEGRSAILARARTLDTLSTARPEAAVSIAKASRALGREPGELPYVPVVAHETSLTLVLDPQSARPLAALAIDPWIESPPASAASAD